MKGRDSCPWENIWLLGPFPSNPGLALSTLSSSRCARLSEYGHATHSTLLLALTTPPSLCPPHRFCEVEFQGPLSIQEEWVRHLQRHILEMNFSKVDPPPEEPQAPASQTAAAEAP